MTGLVFCLATALILAACLVLTIRTERAAGTTRQADPHSGRDFQAEFEADERKNQWTQEP